MFKNKPITRSLFIIILYKGMWGLIEITLGFLIIFSQDLINAELTEDPTDLFANWFLKNFQYSQTNFLHLGLLAIALGIGKIILAICLWYRFHFIRNIGLFFLSIFALYAIYSVSTHFSILKLIALAIDIAILYYFWKELPKHLRWNDEKIVRHQ